MEHKPVKIFDVHIILFVTVSYKQKIHGVFKFLIWNVNWKSHPIFITKHVNANIVYFFNLAKIFSLHRKLHPIIIKIANKLFIFLHNFFWISNMPNKFFINFSNFFWMYFYRINMPNMTPQETLLIFIFDVDSNFFWIS